MGVAVLTGLLVGWGVVLGSIADGAGGLMRRMGGKAR